MNLTSATDRFKEFPPSQMARAIAQQFALLPDRIPTDDGVSDVAPLKAHVNDSRWIVQCPCGGAQLATPADPRFFCVDCLNVWAKGLWVRVEWPAPKDIRQIDDLLGLRQFPAQRNWTPDESLVDLMAENAMHGVTPVFDRT